MLYHHISDLTVKDSSGSSRTGASGPYSSKKQVDGSEEMDQTAPLLLYMQYLHQEITELILLDLFPFNNRPNTGTGETRAILLKYV